MTLHLGILASGSGSNAQAIYDAIERKVLDARINLIFCNKLEAGVLDKAKAWNVPSICLDHRNFSRQDFDAHMVQHLKDAGVDTVVMAGYMRLVTSAFLQAFPNRAINVHPAILPSFKGAHGAADAIAWGVKLSGCSVHFVNEEMDCGSLIVQAALPVHDNDDAQSLQKNIQKLEHRLFPQALQWLAENRLSFNGRQVRLTPSTKKLAHSPPNTLIWPPLEEGF